LARQLSVIHCPGHQKGERKIANVIRAADEAAEQAALGEYVASPFQGRDPLFPWENPNINLKKQNKLQVKYTN
jgi:hypothetical protein